MKQVKITVLRKHLHRDIAEKYLTDYPNVECDFFQEGDTYLYTGEAVMPEGFCPWAWVDIYSRVAALSAGGSHTPWQKRDGVNIVCCLDGVRPVTFLLEAAENGPWT